MDKQEIIEEIWQEVLEFYSEHDLLKYVKFGEPQGKEWNEGQIKKWISEAIEKYPNTFSDEYKDYKYSVAARYVFYNQGKSGKGKDDKAIRKIANVKKKKKSLLSKAKKFIKKHADEIATVAGVVVGVATGNPAIGGAVSNIGNTIGNEVNNTYNKLKSDYAGIKSDIEKTANDYVSKYTEAVGKSGTYIEAGAEVSKKTDLTETKNPISFILEKLFSFLK